MMKKSTSSSLPPPIDQDREGIMAIVIMGVSGAGKSTVGDLLAKSMDYAFVDADDYHPLSNKEKMRRGIGLTEEDRIPWLEAVRDVLRETIILRGTSVILCCSALQKRYREILRSAAEKEYCDNIINSKASVKFVLLDAEAEVLAARLEARAAQGKHFMPPSLLQSQLDLLEIDEEEESIFKVDATLSPQTIVAQIQSFISSSSS